MGRGTGKVLAQRIAPELSATKEPELQHDSSTNTLIRRYRACRVALDGEKGRWEDAVCFPPPFLTFTFHFLPFSLFTFLTVYPSLSYEQQFTKLSCHPGGDVQD